MKQHDGFAADAEVREILKRADIHEAHRLLAEYKCWRRRADGEDQLVEVRIYDMGEDNPNARYSWDITVPGADMPGPIQANAADSIYAAGRTPHWRELDTEAMKDRS